VNGTNRSFHVLVSMSGTHREPTVFVVDDDPAVREYLQWLIESVGLATQVYATAADFLDAYEADTPGCLVLDVRMPGLSGFDLQAELAARRITLPIIMMTAYAEVPMAVRALKAGASDFIQKPFDGQVLIDRVQDAIERDRQARAAQVRCNEIGARLAELTPRQHEVLNGLIAGKPSKVIAAELGLSVKTVDVHRSHIMERLEAQSLPDLFRLLLLARGERAPL
jgi:two-component system response regulator FixJ